MRLVLRFTAVAALATVAGAAPATNPRTSATKNVVVVHQFDPALPVASRLLQGFESVLEQQGDVHVYSEQLDSSRFDGPWNAEDLARWYARKYAGTPVDVVVAAGAEALQFVLRVRSTVWSGVPVVFCAVPREAVAGRTLPRDVTGLVLRFPVKETLELARLLLPDARRVAFFSGSSGADSSYARPFWAAIQQLGGRLEVIDLSGLTYEGLRDRLASLPDGTFAFGISMLRDRAGRHLPGPAYVPTLSSRSRAPIFAVVDTVLGHGVVGGWLVSYEQIGRDAAGVVRRILAGEPPGAIPVSEGTFARLAFDARQLEAWGIPESRLPAGSVVSFKTPSPWVSRPTTIAALGVTLLVQAGLIVALLLQRRSRHRLEADARESRARIAHMNRIGVVGALTGTLAHEVNTPLAAMMNDARAARRFLDSPTPRLADARDAITAVETHGQRARDVLLHVRTALRKDGQPPEVVRLSDVVREAVDLVASDAREHDITVEVAIPATEQRVECDAIQIQQVTLNLVLNALEAAQGLPPERRRIRIEVRAGPDFIEVAVRDWGRGVPAGDRARLFEPFFTTKREGLGMGLSISRTIVESHGGRISMEPGAPVGATFRFSLPVAVEEASEAAESS
jgi:signal transduction histidine kinase